MTITCARSARRVFQCACQAPRRTLSRARISGRRQTDDGHEFAQLRWGFPPAKPKGPPIINFRSEKRRFPIGRCLVPASHFYEFTGKKSPKAKWKFTKTGEDWFCFAGLWRPMPGGDAAFTLLTTEPGPDVAPIHDRQMVILNRDDWTSWVDRLGQRLTF